MAGGEGEGEDERLLRLLMGPWLAEAVAAAVRLGVIDRLGDAPARAGELADELSLAADPLERLLLLLVGLEVLEEREGRFGLAPVGERLHSRHPSSMRDLALLYRSDLFRGAWRGLADSVRTGRQAFASVYGRDVYTYLAEHPVDAALFDAGMAAGGSFADPLPAVYDFSRAERVADVGGGDGSRLAALLQAHPGLHGVLQERPQVLAGARGRLGAFVGEGRCELVGADFLAEVPVVADTFLLCRVLHNWDDDSCARILANCAAAMAPGARLLILERVMPDDRQAWLSRAFDVHMMVMTTGRERTAAEYEALLRPAGLRTLEIRGLDAEMRVLVAGGD
ncbi:methyltransferase [Streptomonospora wellingtoniae]|uniref:Methyltransferase n=1 Tax=Streptomonospora wellingtoniae TaxID=3075544 RepID=A0ABU2KT73_9ACTN|nr:methyltransferase [Streptomonospora sp. DSM 45055]MDT0302494.1 methyltransferase [Streptomonospora sp. DSM 45055]